MDDKILERIADALERIATALEPSDEDEPLTVADNMEYIAGSLQTKGGDDLADVIAGKKES
jgi:hypothetical protein